MGSYPRTVAFINAGSPTSSKLLTANPLTRISLTLSNDPTLTILWNTLAASGGVGIPWGRFNELEGFRTNFSHVVTSSGRDIRLRELFEIPLMLRFERGATTGGVSAFVDVLRRLVPTSAKDVEVVWWILCAG
jgi:hypothetical protein